MNLVGKRNTYKGKVSVLTKAISKRMPVLLSALVYPGAGQLMQKRWLIGGAFIASFSLTFLGLMIAALKNILAYYQLGLVGIEPAKTVETAVLVQWLAWALLIHLINIIDAALGQQRIRKKQERAREKAILEETLMEAIQTSAAESITARGNSSSQNHIAGPHS